MRLAIPLALLVIAATASATSIPAVLPANTALLFALGMIGLGAGLSRPPER